MNDVDNNRNIGATYTVSTANTWEYKNITFAGDTTGTFGNDNGNSLQVEWWLASGSTYNSGSVPTSWEAQVDGDRAAGLTVNIGASTDDDFHLTGVQLEVGTNASDFEHRSFGEELALCRRYYAGADGYMTLHPLNTDNSGGNRRLQREFDTPMRAAPTITVVSGVNIGGTQAVNTHQAGFYKDSAAAGTISYTNSGYTRDAEL